MKTYLEFSVDGDILELKSKDKILDTKNYNYKYIDNIVYNKYNFVVLYNKYNNEEIINNIEYKENITKLPFIEKKLMANLLFLWLIHHII